MQNVASRYAQPGRQDVAAYRERGCLTLAQVLPAALIDELRAVTAGFVERSRGVTASDATFDIAPGHTRERPALRRIKEPPLQHPAYDAAMRHPAVVAAVSALVGPAVRYSSGKLNIKEAGSGGAVEWHQDWAFGAFTNDDVVTVGIPLDAMDGENGCLLVIPGSHRGRVLDHFAGGEFVGAVAEEGWSPEGATAVEVQPGGISLHHTRTLHGSAPNRSGRDRRLLLYTYAAADAWPLHGVGDIEEFDRWMVAGEPVRAPRLEAVPVGPPPQWQRMALRNATSLYDVQRGVRRSAFP